MLEQVEIISCVQCGCEIFFRPARLATLKNAKQQFYCHNGHGQGFFGPTAIEKENEALKSKLMTAERSAQEAKDRAARIERAARLNANACKHCVRKFESPEKLRSHVRRIHEKGPPRIPANVGQIE